MIMKSSIDFDIRQYSLFRPEGGLDMCFFANLNFFVLQIIYIFTLFKFTFLVNGYEVLKSLGDVYICITDVEGQLVQHNNVFS